MWRVLISKYFSQELPKTLAENKSFQQFVVSTELTVKDISQRLQSDPRVSDVSQKVKRLIEDPDRFRK